MKGVLELAGLKLLCYVVLLVMPVMGRMSDQDKHVRFMASRCFANLVTLMPLEVCVCVCVFVCVCVHMCVYMYVHMCVYDCVAVSGWHRESRGDVPKASGEESH